MNLSLLFILANLFEEEKTEKFLIKWRKVKKVESKGFGRDLWYTKGEQKKWKNRKKRNFFQKSVDKQKNEW